jgi:hypothetical protein
LTFSIRYIILFVWIGHFPGEVFMKGFRYANFAPVLALTALALSISPVTIPVLGIIFDIHTKGYMVIEMSMGLLVILGWLPGLAFALIADNLGHRINGHALMINLTHVMASLAILVSLSWIMLLIVAPLISYFLT